ncbi:MAG: hypothetical protein ACT4PV_11660, partial [Planctomycetaceae bacterium]
CFPGVWRWLWGRAGCLVVAPAPPMSGGVGGLGIYLMERCADRLEYNDRGNRVTITKLRGAGEGRRAT